MTDSHRSDTPPQILANRYEIQQQLGKKAGRQTLLARNLETQDLVVVKLLTFDRNFIWDDLKLFERESETLQSLNHPCIPRYLDYFELDSEEIKGFALVQSYINAPSLEQQLKAGRSFAEEEVKELAKSLLEILIYLHGRQPYVVHRDIKPSNILLGDRSGNSIGQVYLVDFGSVQTLASRSSSTMTVVGSYGYMAPEQFVGRATIASDLYSLGATLIYLVTGQHPGELPHLDLRIEFDRFANNISPSFCYWLKRMTEPLLSQRFTLAADALQALEQLSESNLTATIQTNYCQPSKSKVVLIKNANSLQVIIQPIGFFSISTFLCLFILFGCVQAIIHSFSVVSNNVGFYWWLTLVTSSVLYIGTFCSFIRIMLNIFGRRKLHIDRNQISLTEELFGIKCHDSPPNSRQHICRLERTIQNYNGIIWSFLTIKTEKQKYLLNTSYFSVTFAELEWLAQELSDWLNLPIINRPLAKVVTKSDN
jgi:serine/threonine protein kinase